MNENTRSKTVLAAVAALAIEREEIFDSFTLSRVAGAVISEYAAKREIDLDYTDGSAIRMTAHRPFRNTEELEWICDSLGIKQEDNVFTVEAEPLLGILVLSVLCVYLWDFKTSHRMMEVLKLM